MLLVSEPYLKMLQEYGEPKPEDRDTREENVNEAIVASLPVSYRTSGNALLSFLKNNGIEADDQSRAMIDGETIEGSHLGDLIHDLLRYRTGVEPPKGFEALAKALGKKNVSRELIKNPARYELINSLKESERSRTVKPVKSLTPTGIPRVRPQRPERQHRDNPSRRQPSKPKRRGENAPVRSKAWVRW